MTPLIEAAVPAEWREALHGWPGRRAEDLVRQARELAEASWVEHPSAELFDLPEG